MPILANPKHEIIAQQLAKGTGIVDAYAAGGYARTAPSATKFAQRPEIRARVKEIQQARIKTEFDASENAAKALGIDKKWVLERLRWNAERCLRGQPVFDANGFQIPGKFTGRPDAGGANQALRLIGMELGMFIERHEIGGPGDFSRLTDEELAKRALDDAAALGLPAEATEALLLTFGPSAPESEDGTE
jgi:phage terminase small subunit